MVIASLVVEKLRLMMSLSQSVSSSLVLVLSAVVGCSSLLSSVKPLAKGWFQLVLVSGRAASNKPPSSCRAWKSCLPLSVTYSFFSYSGKFWATDAVFFKV